MTLSATNAQAIVQFQLNSRPLTAINPGLQEAPLRASADAGCKQISLTYWALIRTMRKLTTLFAPARAALVPALVALLVFPLSGAAVAADAKAGKAKAGVCAGCHGVTGQSAQPIWPNIAGQGAAYIERQLQAFKSGGRTGAMAAQMAPIVATLTDSDMANIAVYFSSLPAATGKADASVAAIGEQLYRGGDAKNGIPACMSCHGPGGKGMAAAGFPAVSGQHSQYSVAQLKAFAEGTRTGPQADMMKTIASRLDEAQMQAVSQYMAGLR